MKYPLFFYLVICLFIDSSGQFKESRNVDDTSSKVWVYFTDKQLTKENVTLRTYSRRLKVSYRENTDDLPVKTEYIQQIESLGAILRHVFKWENAASFTVSSSQLNQIRAFPFVKHIEPVSVYSRNIDKSQIKLQKKKIDSNQYGLAYNQLQSINVPSAHSYLMDERGFGAPGEGILIAFFDTGFRLKHNVFAKVNKGQIKAAYDFIDNDNSVEDPDSVFENVDHPYYQNDDHGSKTLSLVAGYDPGKFMGVAWGAQFALARTENTYYDSVSGLETEIHSEEDNWAAAIVWAESLGVDIVSSSLSYRDGFQDTVTILNGNTTRKDANYQYSDLDGQTTIVSRAALGAIKRGMIIVNAMGNEGSDREGSLCAPADVDGVISVGAVDSTGIIASFSSTGPTSDGRIKPDVVALGVSVIVPTINGNSTYINGNGTSFSTPLIAGVCALIMQSLGTRDNKKIREALYKSCSFLPGQTTIDYRYGYGLPDALKACKLIADSSRISNKETFDLKYNISSDNSVTNKRGIQFTIEKSDRKNDITLYIFTIDGSIVWKKCATVFPSGTTVLHWDGKNKYGNGVTPGIYFAAIEYNRKIFGKKIFISG